MVFVDAFNRVIYEPLNPKHEFKVISLEALGEWALEMGWGKKGKLIEWNLAEDAFYVYRKIAVGCLGEKEIKKRLEKLYAKKQDFTKQEGKDYE